MVHTRIASDLRNLSYIVGPSPVSNTFQSNAASPASRLVLLPSTSPVSTQPSAIAQDRRHLLEECVKVSSHRVAAFLAEAAVLVLVLGILDRFLASNRLELHWVGGAFLISTVLLASSIALELSARLWLARS